MAKETYVHGKRDLCTWQKRPMYMAKETYVDGKRGLCTWQKRPMCHHPQNDLRSLTRSAITAIQPLIRCLYASWDVTSSYMLCHIIIHAMSHHRLLDACMHPGREQKRETVALR